MTSPRAEKAVLTLWFINTPQGTSPAEVLRRQPLADRGFGRKFLAQLNPQLPVTPIGQFPLNRSAHVGPSEYYIGGYPGVAVVQTLVAPVALPELDANWRAAIPAHTVLAFLHDEETGCAGFARWEDGELRRCLQATRYELREDHGLPEPFEAPYWAGEMNEQLGGISLPFEPVDLMTAAASAWLGVDVSEDGPALNVVGYATDGRPEPKVDEPRRAAQRSSANSGQLVMRSAQKLGISSTNPDYDDYEAAPFSPRGVFGDLVSSASAAASTAAATASTYAASASRVVRGWLRRH